MSPLISAHKLSCGTAGLPPLEAFRRAQALGVDFVEFDLRRAPDGTLLVQHDPGPPAPGAPTLDQLLDAYQGPARLHVDLKDTGCEDELVMRLRQRLPAGRFVVTSLEDASVALLKRNHPDVQVGLSLGRDLEGADRATRLATRLSELFPQGRVSRCRPDFLAVHQRLAELRLLDFCARQGLPAWVWTVDEEAELERFLADSGVAAVITNRPDLALGKRKAGGRSGNLALMRIEREATLERPAGEVWAVLADWPGHPAWQPTLESAALEGELRPGAAITEVRHGYGQRLTFDLTITDLEPGRLIRAEGKSRGMVSLHAAESFELEPAPGGSRVRLGLEYEVPLILRPLAHGVETEVTAQLDAALARLRELLESRTAV